jgi:hypothetical protein
MGNKTLSTEWIKEPVWKALTTCMWEPKESNAVKQAKKAEGSK